MPQRTIYIFIDASNIIYGARSYGWKMDFEKLLRYLITRFQATRILYYAGLDSGNKQQLQFVGDEYCVSGGGGNLATGPACTLTLCPYPTGYTPGDGYWTSDYIEAASASSRSNPCLGTPGCTNPGGYCTSSDTYIHRKIDCTCKWKHNSTEYR